MMVHWSMLPDKLFVKLHHVGDRGVVAHVPNDALEDSHDVVSYRHLGHLMKGLFNRY